LVAVDNGGNVVHTALPLLDNVEYAPDGSMIHNAVGSTATVTQSSQITPGVPIVVPGVVAAPLHILAPDGGIDPAGVWGQHVTHVTRDGWDPTNRLQFYNHKEGDAVVLDISHVASVHGHGGEAGVFVTFPGHPNEGFFLGGDLHKIEPGSTQVIPGTNGMTYGDFYTLLNKNALKTFDYASELTHHREVFNVHALEAAEKFVDAAGNVHIKVGATILGSDKIPEIPTAPPVPDIITYKIAAEAPPITESVTPPAFEIRTVWPRPELYYLPFVVRSPVERSVSRAEGKIFKDEEEKKRLAKEEAKKAKEAEKKAKEEEKRKAKEVKKDKTAKKLEEADQIIGADKKTEKKDESGESTKPYVPTEEEKAEAKKEADEQNKQTFLQNRNAMIMRINNDQKDLKPEIFAERYKRPAAEFEGKPEAVAKFATEMTLNLLYKNVYQAEDYYHALESQYTPDQKALTTKTNQVSQALGSNKTYMEKVEEISGLTESDAKYASLKQELEKLEKAALEKVGLNNINTYEDLMKKIDEMHKQISETDGFKNKLRELSEATLARLRQQVDVWVAEAAAAKAAEAKPVGAAKPAAAVVAKVT